MHASTTKGEFLLSLAKRRGRVPYPTLIFSPSYKNTAHAHESLPDSVVVPRKGMMAKGVTGIKQELKVKCEFTRSCEYDWFS